MNSSHDRNVYFAESRSLARPTAVRGNDEPRKIRATRSLLLTCDSRKRRRRRRDGETENLPQREKVKGEKK